MKTLTVTARGQVTFRKDVLQHPGIRPGEKIELEQQPGWEGYAQGWAATGQNRQLPWPARG
jgi:hypothetical protein